MTLPIQFVNDVRLGEEFKFCPYCSRVLFFEEGEEGSMDDKVATEAEIEEGSMADFIDLDEFEDLL
jgi:hypothetical protein